LTFNKTQVLFSGFLHYFDDRQAQIALEADAPLNQRTNKQPANQPPTHPTNQASNQPSNQSTSHPTKQSINQPTKQPTNQQPNQPTTHTHTQTKISGLQNLRIIVVHPFEKRPLN
jgi:hypothetical protein